MEYVILRGKIPGESRARLVNADSLRDLVDPDEIFESRFGGAVEEIGRVQIFGDAERLEGCYVEE